MLIDCQNCQAKPAACDGCVVAHIFSSAERAEIVAAPHSLNQAQSDAISNLAVHGLVKPLHFATN
jgi:hypothetical protein